jgi:hypothetical protein
MRLKIAPIVGAEWRVPLLIAGVCLIVQMLSATLQNRSLETPNAATWLAQTLVTEGRYAYGDLRALQLPGESIYLAAGFTAVPEPLWRYLHVPVIVLFVTAVATIGQMIGGPRLALFAGATATFDPYIIRHGPVWDDTLLAAALEWTVFVVLIGTMSNFAGPAKFGRSMLPVVLGLAAIASMTRALSQVLFIAVACIAIAYPLLRPLRRTAMAILLGVVIAVGGWGVRNANVLGTFFIGSSHDGEVLFKSNCAYTRQGIRELGVVGTFMHECSATEAAHALSLSELDFDRQLREYALAYMVSNPIESAKTAAFKVAVSLSGFNFALSPLAPRNLLTVMTSLLTVSLGSFGLFLLSRRRQKSPSLQVLLILCLTTGALTLLMLAVGPTGVRYRIGFSGFFYLGIAAVMVEWLPRTLPHLRVATRSVDAVTS